MSEDTRAEFEERVVAINRVAKVVKGGRRFGFNSIVVVGNGDGKVGIGLGKAKMLLKLFARLLRMLIKIQSVTLFKSTIPHEMYSEYGAAKNYMRPASSGTGVIAGGAARAVLELAGVHDVLTKNIGSINPHNVVKATLNGLLVQKTKRLY